MWNTLGSSLDPGTAQNAQQLMAQKLMSTSPAPVANSSADSAAANTLAQAAKGAMMPGMMQTAGTGQTPDWMQWIGKQFGGGGAAASPFDAGGFGGV
jgi:hypothetical protein